jgi:exoribonuclease-2
LLNSLVAYRGKPAQITNIVGDKFEISIIDGKTLKVRNKDFRLLSPQFSNTLTTTLSADWSVLEELAEEVLTVEELSNWLFNEYSPASSWQLFLLVEDGVYFYWQKDKIFIRPPQQVLTIKTQREAEQQQELALQQFLERIAQKTWATEDEVFLQEIEKVAHNQLKSSKILKKLAIPQTSAAAHQFLVELGYWNITHNPHPTRNKIHPEQEISLIEETFERVNLTHFTSYAIDNVGSSDADDAIAIEDNTIWISIADVGSFASEELLHYAQKRISNLYLPNEIIHMLPTAITEKSALTGMSNALSIGFTMSSDCKIIENIQVVKSMVAVENISYDEVDNHIEDSFNHLYTLAQQHKNYRKNNGSFSLDLPKVDVRLQDEQVLLYPQKNTKARLMVAEFMILAGRVISQFATLNNIPIPFVSQERGKFSDEVLQQETLTMSESFASTKLFKRSATSTIPHSHFGLGLDSYTRVTSPLRRYLDLLTHTQLTRFIAQKTLLTTEEIYNNIGICNAYSQIINQTTRDSNNYYKTLYVLQHKNEVFDATIISNAGKKKLIMIEKLAMIKDIKTDKNLDEQIKIKCYDINIFTQEFSVKEC